MLTTIRILYTLLLWTLSLIGLMLLVVLWDIRRHPLSVFHYLNLLRGLPF